MCAQTLEIPVVKMKTKYIVESMSRCLTFAMFFMSKNVNVLRRRSCTCDIGHGVLFI